MQIETISEGLSLFMPLIILIVFAALKKVAVGAGIIFLYFGTMHLITNALVCTYELSTSPSPGDAPPTVTRPDHSDGFYGFAKGQTTGFFAWSFAAFIAATILGAIGLMSTFVKFFSKFSFAYPQSMIGRFLLFSLGVVGVVFNSIAIAHTKKCDSRVFDIFDDHNFIPIMCTFSGFFLILIGLTHGDTKIKQSARNFDARFAPLIRARVSPTFSQSVSPHYSVS